MSSQIYSIIRCVGDNYKKVQKCIDNQMDFDRWGMYHAHKVGGSYHDQIIWFSGSHDDFRSHIDENFLLNKLKENNVTINDPNATPEKYGRDLFIPEKGRDHTGRSVKTLFATVLC